MEGAKCPLHRDQLELSVLEGQPDEQAPLNGAVQVIPSSAEESRQDQVNTRSPWSSCNKNLVGKYKLWMAIVSIFLGLTIVIIISLCLLGAAYIDEDENEILELSSNKTFLVMLKIPEECVTEEELLNLLTKRLTDAYSSSPSLSRYFTSIEAVNFSSENATVTYNLQFGVPSEDVGFMKYVMSEELVLGILLQDFHDQNLSGCKTLGLDPASFSLSGEHESQPPPQIRVEAVDEVESGEERRKNQRKQLQNEALPMADSSPPPSLGDEENAFHVTETIP